MRRPGPRPLALALEAVAAAHAPQTLLARVQSAWPAAAGPAVAAEAEPVSERAGVVTFACSSAVWAQELELLSGELLAGLRRALGEDSAAAAALAGLRFTGRRAAART